MTKKAIVVGATSGMGRALAELLVQKGYVVGITGRRNHLLEEIKGSKPESYISKQFDIDNYDAVNSNLDELSDLLGGIDLLVLSSGTGKRNPELKIDYETDVVKTNVLGFVAVINWAYKYFETKGSGSMAAISSIAGIRGLSVSPSYSASKAYQMTYLEALRQKAKTSGNLTSITDIRAGFVDTAMGNGAGSFWITSPEKAANQILKAVRRKKSIVYITKRWFYIGWVLRIIPNFIFDRIKI